MADDPPKPKLKLRKGDRISPDVAKALADGENSLEIAKILIDGDAAIRRAEKALKRFEMIEATRKAKMT